MRRLAVVLEYDGAGYHGSQAQPTGLSIQQALEAAVARLTGEQVRAAFAGRTDAGVHARGQVAAFSSETRLPVTTLTRGLNALLPEDIAVSAMLETPVGFDPRRQALSRRYRYQIWNAPARSPLGRRRSWHVRAPLDIEAMRQAAAVLVGEHDFASFGGPLAAGRGSRRSVEQTVVRRHAARVTFEIVANAFLPHQVRRTAGALVEVGSGRLPAEAFTGWLAQPRTGVAGPTAPAHGLCLMQVTYDSSLSFPSGDSGAEWWSDEDL